MLATPPTATRPLTRPLTPPLTPRVPSRYQQAIYDWVRHGCGDALVDAVPGSGKTTTLVDAAALIDGDGLFCAFNKHIADELRVRLPDTMDASTIHSLGFATLRAAGLTSTVQQDKYRRLTEAYFEHDRGLDTTTARELVGLTLPVLRLAQLTLTPPDNLHALRAMALDYDLDMTSWDQVAPAIAPLLQHGVDRRATTIDFNDMVTLPTILGLTPRQRDWVMVDEVQDLSVAQRELVLRARRPGGRVIAVGDPRQSMYRFAGADSGSMERLAERSGARTLPLSISYRLPRIHAALVNTVYNTVESPPNAPEGVVETMEEADATPAMRVGDMVLCRVNAPLVTLAYTLIRRGVPARVRGREIGTGLAAVVKKVETRPGFTMRRLPDALAAYVERLERELSAAAGAGGTTGAQGDGGRVAMAVAGARDRTATIQAIADATRPPDTAALKDAILALFKDDEQPCVSLSTVHKAKGLEADRVWIIAPDKMPHPMARGLAQKEQEENVRYVAYSRSKSELYFVRDDTPDTRQSATLGGAEPLRYGSRIHA